MIGLGEEDLLLADALQLAPRAPWLEIASALGRSVASVRRRWARLSEAGLAWTGATMGAASRRGVFLELSCRDRDVDAAASALARLPEIITVGRSTGRWGLYAIVVAPTAPALISAISLPARLEEEVASTGSRATVFTEIFGGPRWRSHVLSRATASTMARRPRRDGRPTGPGTRQRELFAALSQDARISHAELARRLSTSPAAVRAQLAAMERDGILDYRADLARTDAGWPLSGLLWLEVPDERIAVVGRAIGDLPAVRFAASTVGPATLIVVVGLRSAGDLLATSAALVEANPGIRIVDRRIVPRLDKVHGRLLLPDGRADAAIPIDPWALDPAFAPIRGV